MWCHLLWLAPIASLGLFWVLPWPAAATVNAAVLLVTLSVALPVFRSLRQPPQTGVEALVGRRGTVITPLNPQGTIRLGSEIWSATSAEPMAEGREVRVVAVRGLWLTVVPDGAPTGDPTSGTEHKGIQS